jgi:hypothetical protein
MRPGKEIFMPLQSAPASEGLEWAEELFARARRAARRARVRTLTDCLAVRLVACAVFAGAIAGMVWWATGLPAQL